MALTLPQPKLHVPQYRWVNRTITWNTTQHFYTISESFSGFFMCSLNPIHNNRNISLISHILWSSHSSSHPDLRYGFNTIRSTVENVWLHCHFWTVAYAQRNVKKRFNSTNFKMFSFALTSVWKHRVHVKLSPCYDILMSSKWFPANVWEMVAGWTCWDLKLFNSWKASVSLMVHCRLKCVFWCAISVSVLDVQ